MQESASGAANQVPRTFRHGPSDPVVFADGPGTWAEIFIAASPDDVWTAVTDIDLPAKFSEEFLGATWKTDGPRRGAWFVGKSRHPAIGQWETESVVDEYEPGRTFGWAVADPENPGARWRFRLEPADGGTRLRFEVSLGPGPSGATMAIAARPDKEAQIIHRRISELHANMVRTVEGIRRTIEDR